MNFEPRENDENQIFASAESCLHQVRNNEMRKCQTDNLLSRTNSFKTDGINLMNAIKFRKAHQKRKWNGLYYTTDSRNAPVRISRKRKRKPNE